MAVLQCRQLPDRAGGKSEDTGHALEIQNGDLMTSSPPGNHLFRPSGFTGAQTRTPGWLAGRGYHDAVPAGYTAFSLLLMHTPWTANTIAIGDGYAAPIRMAPLGPQAGPTGPSMSIVILGRDRHGGVARSISSRLFMGQGRYVKLSCPGGVATTKDGPVTTRIS